MTNWTCIDLFSGCGGFTLGMMRAGFRVLSAVDCDQDAVETLRSNLTSVPDKTVLPVGQVLQRDLTKFSPLELSEILGATHVDVIVGGPPCQGFSTARQVDGANHGERLREDPRRQLYREFLRFVEFFQPRVFVMENVLGIRSSAGGAYFTAVQKEARQLGRKSGRCGYRVHGQIEDAWELGTPQKRRRQLIVGVRKDLPGFLPQLKAAPRAEARTWLGATIGDLPPLRAGTGEDECEYDQSRRDKHLRDGGDTSATYLFSVLQIHFAKKLTNHTARPHSDRDLRDFARLREGESSAIAMRERGVQFEFPYDKSSFKDRYTRQSRWKACSTIVAHLSKDGLMFIHPTQNRSLTPREAARVQSFPDWFRFPASRTKSFRLIGNAVPPLVSEAVGLATKKLMEETMQSQNRIEFRLKPLPQDDNEAVEWLLPLVDKDARSLRAVDGDNFKKAWFAISFLYMGLHPDSALDHGANLAHDRETTSEIREREPRLLSPYYERSGWPLLLAPIAKEAWRRYEGNQLSDNEFYCSEAQMAGICSRNPELADQVAAERSKVALNDA